MKIRYFKMEEFKCRCCGRVVYPENIETLVENVLDPARQKFGGPVLVNSGYRCPKHNAEVGGVQRSQHLVGEAADIRPNENHNENENLKRLARIIVENGKFDQLILYPTFLHVSYKRSGANRHNILKKTASGYQRINNI